MACVMDFCVRQILLRTYLQDIQKVEDLGLMEVRM